MGKLIMEIKKIFFILEEFFSKDDLEVFINRSKDDLYLYHFGFGTWIRNELIHPPNSELYPLFIENGIDSSDEMSLFIIELFHEYLRIDRR